ncbi:hypothetical protein AMEX_G25518 [Astyanax mexicanus]|uniref:CAP-Gly domain-containing protein n=1 Tax=Astyanax mexicanus TaxID=7994 RepID=A0A8T2KVK5_ASTMX|nr:hypothetical protein AMEX_G25518 [Astyanax mexicanus]
MPAMNRPGFLTKAGLRRLLTSDEVWSFGRKRSSGEQIQTEQESLQQTPPGSKDLCDPKRFLAYSHQSQPCRHSSAERKAKREDGKSPLEREPLKKDLKANGYEHEADKSIQSPLRKGQHRERHERVTTPKNSEVFSGEQIQYPTDVTWTPVKHVQNFKSGHHNQTSCGITDRPPIVSSLSSDIEEDLPYDYEDSHQTPREEREAKLQEVLKTYSAAEDMTLDHGQALTDNATFNVENNQRSQTVLLLNNNHEICGAPRKTESNPSFARIWQGTKEAIADKPIIANLVQALASCDLKRGEESPSCDDSLSETEDKSEPFSLQSEALAWSEEERDFVNDEKTEASTCSSLVFAEKFVVAPEPSQHCHQSNPEHNEVGFHDVPHHYEREMTAECTLSEILSPVDEVLSYGSAELPPSLNGGGCSAPNSNSLPLPPPAFEIITWTSEEDLPAAPADFLEDVSINSENFPNLPVDLSLGRREGLASIGSGSLGASDIINEALIGDDCKTLPSGQTTGQTPGQTLGQDEEDECSDYTGSLLAYESNESEDPLSFFHIGDRVLVCNSRPGVLKYKGPTTFAGGFWAGVELDTPRGNHNGTFRGVKYFTCKKNHGVLVRAEDVTHPSREWCSYLNTGAHQESFSDEDPPNGQNGTNGNRPSRPSGNRQGIKKDSQTNPAHDPSAQKQICHQEPCENDATRDSSNELSSCSRSSEKSPLKVDHNLFCYNEDSKHHADESAALIERLTDEIFSDALKSVQETRKRHRQIIGSKHDSKSIDSSFRKRENSTFATSKPCLMDQWHQVHPEIPPQIQIQPHDHSVVYRLVDATVEALCGQAGEGALDACETPSYLVDEKSRKDYRQVLFQLVSDILHEVCTDILETSSSDQKTDETSLLSALQKGQISVSYLKAAVRRETQKVLNLERTDQHMTEMLQTLCKYWYAKRDRVDYILIQELHSEERQWTDYSADQITVKIRLSEEIFELLLDDTISVLNHIYLSDSE